MRHKLDRRHFLYSMFGSVGAMLATRVGWLFPEAQTASAGTGLVTPGVDIPLSAVAGEMYADFLLLPDGAPVPSTVKYPPQGIPNVCGVGAGRHDYAMAITEHVAEPNALARKGGFPLYTLNGLSNGFRPAGGYLIRYASGEPFGASQNFESYDARTSRWESTVGFWSQLIFPVPFPLWATNPVEPGVAGVTLVKVDFLPTPGIMTPTATGYVFYWIEKSVFYMLRAEYNQSHEETRSLISLLMRVEK